MKMQQTRSYWRLVAVAGVVSAFIASACVVTTTDDNTAGAAGTGTAGAGTAGAGTAGAGTAGSGTAGAGTAGSNTAGTAGAPATSFECDTDDGELQGTPTSCTPMDAQDACQTCIQSKCCDQFSACYAEGPRDQCGWGGPPVSLGQATVGEIACAQVWLKKAVTDSGTAVTDADVQVAANNCATSPSNGAVKDCKGVIGVRTSDAIACLRDNCGLPCFGAE